MIGVMQAETYAARLAAKYLDKELAGRLATIVRQQRAPTSAFRIQQIQLLGRGMRGADHDRLWNQLEAEIHLHRHKTVIRACRGRLRSSGGGNTETAPSEADSANSRNVSGGGVNSKGVGVVRFVTLVKEPHEGLGISITVDMQPLQPTEELSVCRAAESTACRSSYPKFIPISRLIDVASSTLATRSSRRTASAYAMLSTTKQCEFCRKRWRLVCRPHAVYKASALPDDRFEFVSARSCVCGARR